MISEEEVDVQFQDQDGKWNISLFFILSDSLVLYRME